MCQINNDNRECNFQQYFQRWESLEKTDKNLIEVLKSSLVLPLSKEDYCLFHSVDIDWKKENNFDSFFSDFFLLSEWDKEITSVDIADSVIVAPAEKADIIFNSSTFKKKIRIVNSSFVNNLHFKMSIFRNDIDFHKVIFEGEVYFNECQFLKATFFVRCHFFKKAYFNSAIFYGETERDHTSLNFSIFEAQANFSGCRFQGKKADANFQLITFKDVAYFTGCHFEKRGLFSGTCFKKRADFDGVSFEKDVFFTPRSEEGKIFNSTFTDLNFSKVTFHGKATFENSFIGKAVFSEIRVFSMLEFINATFLASTFDDLYLESNGRVHFIGNQHNTVFTEPISFHITNESFQGYLYFKQVKVAYITAPHLKILQDLRETERVFFSDDCEFAVNSNYISYTVSGGEGNYDLLITIFEGLKKWIYIFLRNPKIVMLEVTKTEPSTNTILIKVTWGQKKDFDLYVNLALYYFQSLPYQNHEYSTFLKRLLDPDFLKSFLGHDQPINRNIKIELENHIAEVSFSITNTLQRASLIQFKIQLQKRSISNNISEESLLDYSIDLGALNEDLKEVATATFNNPLRQVLDNTLIEQMYQAINNLNFNNLIILMDNSTNYKTGNINVDRGILQIGHSNNASNAMSENDLDFNKLLEELPQLVGALKTDQGNDLNKEELYAIVAAYEASKRKDKKTVIEKLGAAGKWVADVASKIGIEYVKGLLPK